MRFHCSSCAAGQDALHLSEHGFITDRNGQPQAFHRLDTPPELAQAYQQMLAIAKPQRPPRLLCRDVIGGAAGRWFNLGVIVLGLSEIDTLAEKLWQKLSADPRWQGRVPGLARVKQLARVWILAHELGHELTYEGQPSPHDNNVEAAADYWAGEITAALPGSDQTLGQTFFALIGCNEQFCTHPSSDNRARAYSDGFAARLGAELPPPQNNGASPGEVLLGAGAVAGGVYLFAKVLGALLDGGKTYDADAARYRNRKGRYAKG